MKTVQINELLSETKFSELTQEQRKQVAQMSLAFVEAFKPKSKMNAKQAGKALLDAGIALGAGATGAIVGALTFVMHPVFFVLGLPYTAAATFLLPLIYGGKAVKETVRAVNDPHFPSSSYNSALKLKENLSEFLKDLNIDDEEFFSAIRSKLLDDKWTSKFSLKEEEDALHAQKELLIASVINTEEQKQAQSSSVDIQKYLSLYEFVDPDVTRKRLNLNLRNFDELSQVNLANVLDQLYGENKTEKQQRLIDKLKFYYAFQQSALKLNKEDFKKNGDLSTNTIWALDTTSVTALKLELFHRAIDTESVREYVMSQLPHIDHVDESILKKLIEEAKAHKPSQVEKPKIDEQSDLFGIKQKVQEFKEIGKNELNDVRKLMRR